MDQDDDRARARIYAIFPHGLFLDEDIGELVRVLEERETEIRGIVIRLLKDAEGSGSNPATLLFDAAASMGVELLIAALNAIPSSFGNNEPADAVDDIANSVCQDAIKFALRKYRVLSSEVLERKSPVDPVALSAMKKRCILLREVAKHEFRAWRLVTCRVCYRHYRAVEYSACPSCEIRARDASRADGQTTSGEPSTDVKHIGPGDRARFGQMGMPPVLSQPSLRERMEKCAAVMGIKIFCQGAKISPASYHKIRHGKGRKTVLAKVEHFLAAQESPENSIKV